MSNLNPLVDYNPIALTLNKLLSHSNLLSNLSTFTKNLLINNTALNVNKFFFGIGALAISYKIGKICYGLVNSWKWVPSHYGNRKALASGGLRQRYGDCYVVVTGCTDGIGLAFVIQLAKMGFGVVLVARNIEKLERRIIQVKNICPNFRYEKVIGDLTNPDHIRRVSQQLANLSKKIDIGIVINNAGMTVSKFKNFVKQDPKDIKDIFTINFYATYQINSVMLPILRARAPRSAIINISSCCGVYLSQGNGSYTPSKVMSDIYSRTLCQQNRDKVDVLTVRPFGVTTPMMSMLKSKFIISPKDCVLSSLADLGHQDTSWSGFMHKVQAEFLGKMSEELRFVFYDKVFSYAKQ